MKQDQKRSRQSEDQVNTVVDYVHVGNDLMTRVDSAPLTICNEAQEEDKANIKETSRYKKLWTRACTVGRTYKSVSLENKGSVARDHLALERTFLAWLRTSLAFASIGVAVTQLFRLNTVRSSAPAIDYYETILTSSDTTQHFCRLGKPLGTTFIGISIATLLLGSNRYFECQKWIIRGKFPACRGSVTLMVIMTFALMAASLSIILLEPNK